MNLSHTFVPYLFPIRISPMGEASLNKYLIFLTVFLTWEMPRKIHRWETPILDQSRP